MYSFLFDNRKDSIAAIDPFQTPDRDSLIVKEQSPWSSAGPFPEGPLYEEKHVITIKHHLTINPLAIAYASAGSSRSDLSRITKLMSDWSKSIRNQIVFR